MSLESKVSHIYTDKIGSFHSTPFVENYDIQKIVL